MGGVDRGGLVVSLGRGETEFRDPVEPGKILLDFDRGAIRPAKAARWGGSPQ